MKKLFLLLLIAPMIGFGQSQYRLESHTDTQMGNNRKIIKDYDENGNLKYSLFKNFDEDSQTFINASKTNYIYDNNNLQTENTAFRWENESWLNTHKWNYFVTLRSHYKYNYMTVRTWMKRLFNKQGLLKAPVIRSAGLTLLPVE